MKPIAFIICLLAGCSFGFSQESVWITGTLANFGEQEIKVNFTDNFVSNESKIYQTTSDENGNFALEVPLRGPQTAAIHFGKRRKGMVFIPGDTIKVQFDDLRYDETVVYQGQSVAEIMYYSKFWAVFYSDSARKELRENIEQMDPIAHPAFLLNVLKAKEAFLEAYHQEHGIAEFFRTEEMNNYRYGFARDCYVFESMYQYRRSQDSTGTMAPLPGTYYDFLAEVSLENEEALSNSEVYPQFLHMYLSHKYRELFKDIDQTRGTAVNPSALILRRIEMAKLLFSGKIEDFLVAGLIKAGIENVSFDLVKEEYETFLAGDADGAYKDAIRKAQEARAHLQPGRAAPAVTLSGLSGEKISLGDYRGKVVYIDFWASWCGPCIKEIPAAKELSETFSTGEDVVFLNISLDKKESDWKNAIDKYSPHGIQAIADTEESDIIKAYSIRGIPRYFLVNPDGTIADPDAPRPSQKEEVIAAIRKALK